MPRTALPNYFKDFRTIHVLVTHTTEEDLKKHYEEMYFSFVEPLIYEERMRLQSVVDALHESNPYKNHNWRKGQAHRKYVKGHEWQGLCEKNIDKTSRYIDFCREFKWCVYEFNWDDDWVKSCTYKIEESRTTYKDLTQQLVEIDAYHWNTAKQQWETDDAEWIKVHELEKAHRNFHHPKSYYVELMKRDKDLKKYYETHGIPDYEDTCSMCIAGRKQKEEYEERVRKEEEEYERQQEEYREEQRKKQHQEQKKHTPTETTIHHCEVCDYKSIHSALYRLHMESKEHERKAKLKVCYCEMCKHQSRNEMEYQLHLSSKKHKKICGEIEPEPAEYRCECCNYSTSIKQNYSLHLKSKKHQQNQSVVIPTTE